MESNETVKTEGNVTPVTENKVSGVKSSGEEPRAPKANVRSSLRENMRTDSGKTKEKIQKAVSATEKVKVTAEPAQTAKADAAVPSPAQVTQAVEAAILPPADMSKEEAEAFNNPSAPGAMAKLQSYFSRRAYEYQSDYTRKVNAVGEKERELGDILGVINPVRDEYARRNISPQQIVQNALAWDKAFGTDRLGAAKEYLEHWGIDPRELITEGDAQPHVNGNGQYLTREEAEALADERVRRQFEQREQEAVASRRFSVVQSFLRSKPLFQDPGTALQLEEKMAPIVAGFASQNPAADPTELLEQAYNLVTKGDPTFSELTNRLAAKAEAERKNAEAEKAIAASRSVSGGPGSGTPKLKANNLRENLRMRMNGAR